MKAADPTKMSVERLLWRCEDAIKELGRAEYNAGVLSGSDEEHKRALAEASRQFEYTMGLVHQLAYPKSEVPPAIGGV